MAQGRSNLKVYILPKIFVDSSVFFTAVNSPSGGSAKIFSQAGKKFSLIVSPVVLAEVERNVESKLPEQALKRFFLLIKRLKILKQRPNKRLIAKAEEIIVEKDAVILAEAKQAKTDYLVTLDKRHFLVKKVRRFVRPCKIVTPRELLKGNPRLS